MNIDNYHKTSYRINQPSYERQDSEETQYMILGAQNVEEKEAEPCGK